MEYHVAQRQGARPYQEDTWCATTQRGWKIFAVFDGHGGDTTARYAAGVLPGKVLAKIKTRSPAAALHESFKETSAEVEPQTADGATALAVLIGQGQLAWANCGDCRLLLVTQGGFTPLSAEHRLDNPTERTRITGIGRAKIFPPYLYVGPDGLMPTRSIGDRTFKSAGVIATPETGQRLQDENDRWLVLATDGVWDVLSNVRVATITGWHKTARTVAEAIADAALQNGGIDNVTVLVVDWQQKPRRQSTAKG